MKGDRAGSGRLKREGMNVRDYIEPTRLYNPASPAGRAAFAWGLIAYPAIASLIAGGLLVMARSGGLDQSVISLLGFAFSVALWAATVFIILRRIRDLGHSRWGIFLLLIPIAGLLIALYLFFRPGHRPVAIAAM